jgi:hypothetical protein
MSVEKLIDQERQVSASIFTVKAPRTHRVEIFSSPNRHDFSSNYAPLPRMSR